MGRGAGTGGAIVFGSDVWCRNAGFFGIGGFTFTVSDAGSDTDLSSKCLLPEFRPLSAEFFPFILSDDVFPLPLSVNVLPFAFSVEIRPFPLSVECLPPPFSLECFPLPLSYDRKTTQEKCSSLS